MNRIEKVREVVDGILVSMTDEEERRCAYVHLYGVAQACGLLAQKRNDNVELSIISGMLHDIYSYANMDFADHALKGSSMAREILIQLAIFTEEEIDKICMAICHHSDKLLTHSAFDEILKDADVMQHIFYNPLFETKPHEKERYLNIISEFGLSQ